MNTRQEALEDYRAWIHEHKIKGATIKDTDSGNIRIDTDYAICEVNFYDLEMIVIELRITRKKDDETMFFLHFELRDEDYAKEMFQEMIETLEELAERKDVQVLLSCTSAMTTSFMANKINEIAKQNSAGYHFDAVPFPELYEKAPDYDMLLLAPQIAYERPQLEKVLTNIPVRDIPAKMFATFDASGILEAVKEEYSRYKKARKKACEKKSVELAENNARIITLAFLNHGRGKAYINCRYYKNGKVIQDETFVKRSKDYLKDIINILDAETVLHDKFDAIGITTPGEVHEGKLSLKNLTFGREDDVDIKETLKERYHVPVAFMNNAQMTIKGFHARHSHYSSCAVISHGIGGRAGGAGIIVNNKLITGAHSISGELKYIIRKFYGLSIMGWGITSPEEMLDTVEFNARCLIATVDPEIILIRNDMLTDVEALRETLLRSIPERNMPKLRMIASTDALDYMMLGIMMMCVDELRETKNVE